MVGESDRFAFGDGAKNRFPTKPAFKGRHQGRIDRHRIVAIGEDCFVAVVRMTLLMAETCCAVGRPLLGT